MHYRANRTAVCACVCLLGAPLTVAQEPDRAYRLGPGDKIGISVLGEADLSIEARLDTSGNLSYPFLGQIAVEGLTLDGLEQAITSGLEGPYLVDPRVTVTLLEYRPFFVYGEVRNPGRIDYQTGLTVARAVALAGGFTERASRSRIEVTRPRDRIDAAVAVGLNDPVLPGDIVTVYESSF